MPSLKIKQWFDGRFDPTSLVTRRTGIVLCFIFGACFMLTILLHYVFAGLDQQIEIWIYSGTNKIGYPLLNKITMLGESLLIVPVCLMLIAWWSGKKERDKVYGLILTVFGGGFVTLILKLFFVSPRPNLDNGWVEKMTLGFPSGHAVMSMLFWGYLAYLLVRAAPERRSKWIFGVAAGGISFIVGLSRLFLGVHYPLDILGGWALGAMWLVLSILVMTKELDQKQGATTAFGFSKS